jgi:hypothetical protein
MILVAEAYIKKDSRNRITLPADLEYEYFCMKRYDDGHVGIQNDWTASSAMFGHPANADSRAVWQGSRSFELPENEPA